MNEKESASHLRLALPNSYTMEGPQTVRTKGKIRIRAFNSSLSTLFPHSYNHLVAAKRFEQCHAYSVILAQEKRVPYFKTADQRRHTSFMLYT